MFDYTKTAFRQTFTKIKRALYFFDIVTQIIYIAYLVYATIAKTGLFAANIILLVLSVAYFAFFLATTSFGKNPEGKVFRKTGKKIYKWSKRLVKLFTLGFAIYDVCVNAAVSPLSVLFVALMAITWIIQILFDVLLKIIENEIGYILEAVKLDTEPITKPAGAIGNFIKKIKGEEVPPKQSPTGTQLKHRERLKEQLQTFREEQKRKKEEAKSRRAEKKLADKESARKEKQSARIERQLIKEADKRKKTEDKRLPAENGDYAELPTPTSSSSPALPQSSKAVSSLPPEEEGAETAVALAPTEDGTEEKPQKKGLRGLFGRKKQ